VPALKTEYYNCAVGPVRRLGVYYVRQAESVMRCAAVWHTSFFLANIVFNYSEES